jgi:hypothetical protein
VPTFAGLLSRPTSGALPIGLLWIFILILGAGLFFTLLGGLKAFFAVSIRSRGYRTLVDAISHRAWAAHVFSIEHGITGDPAFKERAATSAAEADKIDRAAFKASISTASTPSSWCLRRHFASSERLVLELRPSSNRQAHVESHGLLRRV